MDIRPAAAPATRLDAGQFRVGAADPGFRRSTRPCAGGRQLLAGGRQLGVPHVERERRLGVQAPAALAQQGVALAQDALDVAHDGVVAPIERHEGVVEELPSAGRPPLHQRQVVGCEDRHPQHTEQVTGPGQALPVDLDPMTAGRDLGLDEQPAPRMADAARQRARRRRLAPVGPRARALGPHVGGGAPLRTSASAGAPGTTRAWPASRAPPAGWSCPARWAPRRR